MEPNCGVVAVAALLGQPYPPVHARFAVNHGANWRGRTYHHERIAILEQYGAFVRTVPHTRQCVRKLCATLDPANRYMLRVGGHVLAYVDGQLTDQYRTCAPDHPAVARRIVTNVTEIAR